MGFGGSGSKLRSPTPVAPLAQQTEADIVKKQVDTARKLQARINAGSTFLTGLGGPQQALGSFGALS